MRIYLKTFEKKARLDILGTTTDVQGTHCCKIQIEDKIITLYLKSGTTKNFWSLDGLKWLTHTKTSKLPCINIQDQLFQLFYGFMPIQQNDETPGSLVARMPGKVVKIIKSPGEKVEKGEPILIIEAMKMENEIKANTSGTVEKIHVTLNQSINSGETLVTIIS